MEHDLYRWRLDWGARGADPAGLANRFCKTIDELSDIFPAHRHWTWADSPEMNETDGERGYAPLAIVRCDMPRAIARNAFIYEGYDKPIPGSGFWLGAMTNPKNPTHNISYFGGVGSTDFPHLQFMNHVALSTSDTSLISYDAFRAALLLLAEVWEATFAINAPHDIPKGNILYPKIGWMTYASPRLAQSIDMPEDIIVEHRENGGVLMAATKDVFDVSNESHMAAALRIEQATRIVHEDGFDQSIPYR